ncbi:hypothetical protein CF65_00765 [Aggregatibacter actinomycetemcomitans HK1651]|nr:hypothetical protein CF65_00765 [Aggregatibacter actinomycetemcomitans HK1651]
MNLLFQFVLIICALVVCHSYFSLSQIWAIIAKNLKLTMCADWQAKGVLL